MYFAMAVSPVVLEPEPGVEESIWTRVWVRVTTSSIVTSWGVDWAMVRVIDEGESRIVLPGMSGVEVLILYSCRWSVSLHSKQGFFFCTELDGVTRPKWKDLTSGDNKKTFKLSATGGNQEQG